MKEIDLQGMPMIILAGPFAGLEAVCLGQVPEKETWAVSPDGSKDIVYLRFESEFGLLINMGQDPSAN